MKFLTFLTLSLFAAFNVFGQINCNNFWVSVSPDGQYLYFSSDRDAGEYEIYRSDADGHSNILRLTYKTGHSFYPMVSPDGSKILFQQNSYGSESEIFIMDSDGSNLVQLTDNNIHDGNPSFSPDGSHILFEAWDDSNYPEIFTMDLDGNNRVKLTNESGALWNSQPRYNPAGDKIYYLDGFNADNSIVSMDPDGTNKVEITSPNTFGYAEFNLAFNADGSKIVFGTTENKGYNNGSELVIANSDGSDWQFVKLAADMEYFYQAVYNPLSDNLFYNYINFDPRNSIRAIDTDGSNDIALSNCNLVSGINDDHFAQISLYPVPAGNILHIESNNTFFEELSLFDECGNIVKWKEGNHSNINVSDLSPGVYYLQLKNKDLTINKKVILQ